MLLAHLRTIDGDVKLVVVEMQEARNLRQVPKDNYISLVFAVPSLAWIDSSGHAMGGDGQHKAQKKAEEVRLRCQSEQMRVGWLFEGL